MKLFTSPTQKIGLLGEEIAVKYLKNKGFSIIERNYTKKVGEIDIVAKRGNDLHFVEVKTIVKHGNGGYQPFENVTRHKLWKLSKTIEIYLQERGFTPACRQAGETRWEIDIIAVTLDYETRRAGVEAIWNAIG